MKPLLFISHKHSDRRIGDELSQFIVEKTAGSVEVFLSSNPAFKGPMIGQDLTDELKTALLKSSVLVLLYTTADQDWSYCMWECGVATDPMKMATRILVLQCGADSPAVFQDKVRLNARRLKDLQRFVDALLRHDDFFHDHEGPIAGSLETSVIEKYAQELSEALRPHIPPLETEPIEDTANWPHLGLELPMSDVKLIEDTEEGQRLQKTKEALVEHGTIISSNPMMPGLLGLANLPNKPSLEYLISRSSGDQDTDKPPWFLSCCEQVARGISRDLPVIPWATLVAPAGRGAYIPALVRVRRLPAQNTMEFDFYFLNLSDPRSVPATRLMIPKEKFYSHRLNKPPSSEVRLLSFLEQLETVDRHRVPILDSSDRVVFMVHKSMIDQFLVSSVKTEPASVSRLTLEDLLADQGMRSMFEETFAVVAETASVAEAMAAMKSVPNCRDVFVTKHGGREERVLGWLTNVDIAEGAERS